MITPEQIDHLVLRDDLKEFGKFVLSHCAGDSLPDYKKINLLDIPRRVPNIWVVDLREPKGRARLLINFSGANIDSFWGKPLQGTYDMDLLEGHPLLKKIGLHRISCIENKKAGYSQRYFLYRRPVGDTVYIFSESLFFPCSSNGEDVNWGLGCTYYENTTDIGDNFFRQF